MPALNYRKCSISRLMTSLEMLSLNCETASVVPISITFTLASSTAPAPEAALALAGIGPDRTMVEIWADPGVTRNTHTIRVEAATVRLTMTIENVPSEENPRTGKITPLSILACLRGLTSTLKVGS